MFKDKKGRRQDFVCHTGDGDGDGDEGGNFVFLYFICFIFVLPLFDPFPICFRPYTKGTK